MLIDPEKVSRVIAEIAEQEIAPRFGKLSDAEIGVKSGPNDFVTKADLAAEARLEKALGEIRPGATFIGEEGSAADPALLSKLDGDGAYWIVDPLDGTRNFVQGRKEYGTIVALVENHEIRAGWIYAIPDKSCAIAVKGDGATWRGEALARDEHVEALAMRPLKGYRAVGGMASPWKERLVPRLREAFETQSVRCSAYAYINMARGLQDFALYSRARPWDHAAGVLLLSEIGGRAEYLDDGAGYVPRPTFGRPLLVARSTAIWATVRDAMLA